MSPFISNVWKIDPFVTRQDEDGTIGDRIYLADGLGFSSDASFNIVRTISVTSDLGIGQSFSDFFIKDLTSNLALISAAASKRFINSSLTSDLGINQANQLSGGEPLHSNDLTHEAIFDSNTDAGQPVYVSGDGHVDLAQADVQAESGVVGLALDNVIAGGTGRYVIGGFIEKGNWTNVMGSTTLTVGDPYYLDTAVGKLTATAPTTSLNAAVRVARALTSTKLGIEIEPGILL